MKILILEDSQERNNWFGRKLIGNIIHFAKTTAQAEEFLKFHSYDVIFLDHDLEEEHYAAMYGLDEEKELIGTGVDTAKYIVENNYCKEAEIIVHSLNSVGRKNIFDILNDAGYNVKQIPYIELKKRLV